MADSFKKDLSRIGSFNWCRHTLKGIRGGICNIIHRYAKANNKFMSKYDENKESSYLNYWNVNNLYGWEMSKKLPIIAFEWEEDTSKFTKDFIKNYDEKNEIGYIFEVDIKYPEKLQEFHMDLPFLPKIKRLGKVEKLIANTYDKKWICSSGKKF